MYQLNNADTFTLCFALSSFVLVLYLYWSSWTWFAKASAYQFVDALNDKRWKSVDEIRREMESRLLGRLRFMEVERALDNLESEGIARSRIVNSNIFLYVCNDWMPEKQFKLHEGNYGPDLEADPMPVGSLVNA